MQGHSIEQSTEIRFSMVLNQYLNGIMVKISLFRDQHTTATTKRISHGHAIHP